MAKGNEVLGEGKRCLVLAAHPDDAEVYMGSVLLAAQDEGWAIEILLATEGERGTLQPRSGTRMDEARSAAALVGARLSSLGLPDGQLHAATGLEEALRAALLRLRPSLVFAPSKRDPHPDHAALALAFTSLAKTRDTGSWVAWQWLDAGAEPRGACAFAPKRPFEDKEKLILCHASQIPGPSESREHLPHGLDIVERARQRDGVLGRRIGVLHAEPFLPLCPQSDGSAASEPLAEGSCGGPPVLRSVGEFLVHTGHGGRT